MSTEQSNKFRRGHVRSVYIICIEKNLQLIAWAYTSLHLPLLKSSMDETESNQVCLLTKGLTVSHAQTTNM